MLLCQVAYISYFYCTIGIITLVYVESYTILTQVATYKILDTQTPFLRENSLLLVK